MHMTARTILALCLGVFISSLGVPGSGSASETLKAAIMDDLQPWVFKHGDRYEGVYPELIRELAKRSGMKVRFIHCPVKRCELWMKTGEADIVIGLRDTSERRDYIKFLTTPYRFGSPKVFYMRKGTRDKLKKYEDLYNLEVGTQLGSKYFDPFDQDTMIRKQEVASEGQNFHKLISGRIDVVAIPEDRGEYLISKLGLRDSVEKAPYMFPDGSPRYIGISRKSTYLGRVDAFNKIMKSITDDGTLDRLYEDYFFKQFNVPRNSYRWK